MIPRSKYFEDQDRSLATPVPELKLVGIPDSIHDYKFEDFELVGYDPHPHIAAPVSV